MEADTAVPQVAARVRAAILRATDTPAFGELLLRLLARPGRVLAPQAHTAAKWPALVLDPCAAFGGDREAGIAAAAAVEFAVAAADVVDDLVDDEWDDTATSPGRALNAALALPWLAQGCAALAGERLAPERARRIADLCARGYLAACNGEDLDLLFETQAAVSEEQAHEMTRRKAGSLAAMACQVGAAVAVDDPAILELVGDFGRHVGVVAQLLNDLAGVDPDSASRGSDLRRGKKTLPIAYALRCARDEGLPHIEEWFRQSARPGAADEAQLLAAIRDLGALHYTWVVADAHRREALDTLDTLAHRTGRDEVRRLSRLVPPVRLQSVRQ